MDRRGPPKIIYYHAPTRSLQRPPVSRILENAMHNKYDPLDLTGADDIIILCSVDRDRKTSRRGTTPDGPAGRSERRKNNMNI